MASSTEPHLTESELSLLIERGSPDGAARRHLLAGCSPCLERFRRLLMERLRTIEPFARAYLSEEPDDAWRSTSAAGVLSGLSLFEEAEAGRAPGLLRELLALPAAERRGRIRGGRRFRTAALVHCLRERAREEGFRDPALSLELAELAVEVADALAPWDVVPAAVVQELRALAWASLGNAQRVASDLFAAERSFRTALAFRVLSPEHRVELLSLLGSLRIDQVRYAEAREVLEEAIGLCQGMDDACEAKLLTKLAQAWGEAGDPNAALPHLERALGLLGRGAAHLRLFAEHYLVQMLLESGQVERAAEQFRELQSAYRAVENDFGIEQRRKWLAGRLAAARGAGCQAEALFREVREAFGRRDLGYEYALVTLDLAILLVEERRTADVAGLAREMVPLFASREIHGHALAALALFQQSAAAETATAPFLRQLASYLRSARRNPYLPFPLSA